MLILARTMAFQIASYVNIIKNTSFIIMGAVLADDATQQSSTTAIPGGN